MIDLHPDSTYDRERLDLYVERMVDQAMNAHLSAFHPSEPTSDDVGATWSRVAEAGRHALPTDDRCSIPECDELPEDHYHPATITADVLARAIADAFAEHVAIDDPRWPHMIAGYVIEKLPAGLVRSRSCRHGINPDECEFCDSPGADKEEATRQAIQRRGS